MVLPARQPGLTADDVRDLLDERGYPVSKRTVERDLNSLSRIFGITSHGAMPQRWYWASQKRDEILSVELVEAVSLVMAEQLLKATLPHSMLDSMAHKFALARTKLAALNDHPLSQLTEKVRYVPDSLPTCPPKMRSGVLEKVQDALANERCVTVCYEAFNKAEKTYTLHPLSLIQRGRVTYLAATVGEFKDPRLFAVHRMRSVVSTDEPVRVPPKYSVDQYIDQGAMEFGTGKIIQLQAILTEDLAWYLSETPLAEDQKIVYRNGKSHISVSIRDSWQLYFWILSQSNGIEVLKPAYLRKRIHHAHADAAAQYSKKP